MTWEELKEKAKELKGYEIYESIICFKRGHFRITFYKWRGLVSISSWGGCVDIKHRKPEQMLMIMEALK